MKIFNIVSFLANACRIFQLFIKLKIQTFNKGLHTVKQNNYFKRNSKNIEKDCSKGYKS